MRRRIGTKEISPVELVEASIGSVVRTRDRVAGAGYACSARPDLHTVCRSFPKISSALSAKVCGGSKLAKRSLSMARAERERKLTRAEQMASGRPFLEVHREFRNRDVQNVSISYCFHCNEMCLWVYDQLVWPRRAGDPEPKLHAPPNVRRECEKATQTLEASPRGAAALLRLTIEKLCKELGVSGESVKDDIAFFVREDVDA